MIRNIFLELALVATPFLLFFLYRAAVGRRRTETGEAVDETPYQLLFLTGSAVALAALVTAVLLGRDMDPAGQREQVYIPPRTVDGEVQAGFYTSREDAIARGLIEERRGARSAPGDSPAHADDEGEPAPAEPLIP